MLDAPLSHQLAEAVSATQVQLLIYAILAAVVVGFIGTLRGVVEIVRFFRGDPPAEQKYASKAEIAAIRAETAALETRLSGALEDIRSDNKEIFRELRSVGRLLGKMEGRSGD